MSIYHERCEISIIPGKLKSYFNDRAFLMKEKILDINLPLTKMRKLKQLQEYENDSEEYNDLKAKILKDKQFQKEEMYLGKVDKSEKTAICLHFTAGNYGGTDSTTCKTSPNRAIDDHNAVNYWVYRDGTIVE
ncbi:hypothetical protein, partial [Spirochaeta cellobiosiphila]|uniref:hypothetical protein n=1 Tax=Spirochaeta cellobiosiphila TaxID=504483 RepID=UPI00056AAC35